MISTFAAVFLGGLVLVIGGWETTDTLPLWVTAVMQIPLWAGLLGVPWWVVRRRKLSWKTDLGWQFQKKDVLSSTFQARPENSSTELKDSTSSS